MWAWLKGKKTYIITAVGAISAVFGFVPSAGVTALLPLLLDFLTSPGMQEILTYGGIATVRHGLPASK